MSTLRNIMFLMLADGIGNYLRAEILFRARVNPFAAAADVLSASAATTPGASVGDAFIALCAAVPREVVDLGLNKVSRR